MSIGQLIGLMVEKDGFGFPFDAKLTNHEDFSREFWARQNNSDNNNNIDEKIKK